MFTVTIAHSALVFQIEHKLDIARATDLRPASDHRITRSAQAERLEAADIDQHLLTTVTVHPPRIDAKLINRHVDRDGYVCDTPIVFCPACVWWHGPGSPRIRRVICVRTRSYRDSGARSEFVFADSAAQTNRLPTIYRLRRLFADGAAAALLLVASRFRQ